MCANGSRSQTQGDANMVDQSPSFCGDDPLAELSSKGDDLKRVESVNVRSCHLHCAPLALYLK